MIHDFLHQLNSFLLIHGIKTEIFREDIELGVTVNYKAHTVHAQKIDRDELRAILNRAIFQACQQFPMIEVSNENRTFRVKSGYREG